MSGSQSKREYSESGRMGSERKTRGVFLFSLHRRIGPSHFLSITDRIIFNHTTYLVRRTWILTEWSSSRGMTGTVTVHHRPDLSSQLFFMADCGYKSKLSSHYWSQCWIMGIEICFQPDWSPSVWSWRCEAYLRRDSRSRNVSRTIQHYTAS